jgi:hypothetical protein
MVNMFTSQKVRSRMQSEPEFTRLRIGRGSVRAAVTASSSAQAELRPTINLESRNQLTQASAASNISCVVRCFPVEELPLSRQKFR